MPLTAGCSFSKRTLALRSVPASTTAALSIGLIRRSLHMIRMRKTAEDAATWDPSKHPREPAGNSGGGEFKGEGSGGEPLDLSKLKKVGGALGTNPGGTYEDSSGSRYYVKQGKSADHVRTELLAAKLYGLAGASILQYHPVAGGKHVATKWQEKQKG